MPLFSKEIAHVNLLENTYDNITETTQGRVESGVNKHGKEKMNRILALFALCIVLAIILVFFAILFAILIVNADTRSSHLAVEMEKTKAVVDAMNHTIEKLQVAIADGISFSNDTTRLRRLLPMLVGWYEAKNHMAYKVFREKTSWHDAVKKCEILGGGLAAVGLRDPAIWRDIVANVLKPVRYYVWIGLDVFQGHWEWSDGAISFPNNTDWAPEQPNNFEGNQDCALLRYDINWTINDHMCQDIFFYMCEA